MKAILLNTSDISGGAARAAFRLHQGLRQINIDSKMLVQDKISDDRHIIGPDSKLRKAWNKLRPEIDMLPLQLYKKSQKTPYHLQWLPGFPLKNISLFNPDIIHFHWICGGFVPIEFLAKINRSVVWTLHDMWAFTGGCHYSEGCKRYKSSCGKCLQLGSRLEKDFSRWIWHRKHKAWQYLNLTVVTPSRWLAECAKESSLFQNTKIEVIPNGLDLKRYKAMDRSLARELLGLPENKKLVLFGAMKATSDPRKGFQYLQPALQKLKDGPLAKEMEIIVFGSSEPENAPDFGFPVHYLGKLHDDISIALLYSAADVFAAPSVQDNLPNTVMESLACGTPVTAFDIGGMPDMIDHKINGYLAMPFDTLDLARGIEFVLSGETEDMRRAARKKVEETFGIEKVARKYRDLYEEVLRKAIK